MKSRFVGDRFLKQVKNLVSDWSFRSNPSCANFLTAVAFSKGVWDNYQQRTKESSCVYK